MFGTALPLKKSNYFIAYICWSHFDPISPSHEADSPFSPPLSHPHFAHSEEGEVNPTLRAIMKMTKGVRTCRVIAGSRNWVAEQSGKRFMVWRVGLYNILCILYILYILV